MDGLDGEGLVGWVGEGVVEWEGMVGWMGCVGGFDMCVGLGRVGWMERVCWAICGDGLGQFDVGGWGMGGMDRMRRWVGRIGWG